MLERVGGDLAARLQRLEDLEAIRRVMSDYAQAGDDRQGYSVNIERAMLLFRRDAVWDGRPRFGRYEGWEAVRDSFLRAQARIDWSLHYLVDVIESGTRSRRRTWTLVSLRTGTHGQPGNRRTGNGDAGRND